MSGKLGIAIALSGALLLAGCGNSGFLKLGKSANSGVPTDSGPDAKKGSTIWDLFSNAKNPDVTIEVNKYLWKASLETLSFLPVEAADPFSGVIIMGWGRPKGSRRQYRATVYIQDPALDARSLRVSIMTRSGPASRDTVRAIEDAILTRARQLRIADSKL